jgi:beta-glucosidase
MKTRMPLGLLIPALLLNVATFAAAQAPAAKNQPTTAPAKPTEAAKPADAKAPTTTAPAAKAPTAPAAAAPATPAPVESAIVPVPRAGKWTERHELINQRAKDNQGNIDLLFVGDSITQGWEGSGKDVWEKFYGSRKAMNAGIGGDRTQHVLWRLDNGNVEGISPKVAVLMIGTNNSGTNTSEEIAAGVKAIVAKFRAKLPSTKVIVLAIFPRGADENDVKRKVNEGANQIIRSVADNRMVFYRDIGPKFLEKDGTLSKEIMPDLLHLSPAGYEIWAESIEGDVARLLGETGSATTSGNSRVFPRVGRLLRRR